MAKEKVLVTSALPYANGHIHLGHLSGAYLPADIYVRYKRLNGDDVLYVCGSDEHGVPITITADKENVKPKEIIDRYHNANKETFAKFGMSFNVYSRTSLPVHHEDAKNFFLSYHRDGLLNEKKTLQFYDEKAKMFLPDRYVEGTCPKCGYEEARSDECENCGSLYDPSELVNPKSKITGETPVRKETSHWFFPLGKYQERLEKYIAEMNEKFGWKDNVLQYCRGWFKDGLQDRAVTRDLDWGVKVPLEDSEGKVLYVWFEAVLGYISAARDYSEQRGEPDLWKKYWHDPQTKYIAFIGKDNVVFHTIIFPAMLMAWNDGNEVQYVLPQNVPANEFLNYESKKFSKSRGWGIYAKDFLEMFPSDPLRYYLASNAPENKDTDFMWKEFQSKNNDELADILGNFVNRTFIFAGKHFENSVPELGELSDEDKNMLALIEATPGKVAAHLEKYKVKDALTEMMNLARAGNKYFNDSEPWKSVKTDKSKCGTTINICLNTIYTLAEVFAPVIPETSGKMFKMLNAEITEWLESGKQNLSAGHKLNKPEILFSKIEDSVIDKQLSQLDSPGPKEEEEPKITYDDFAKVQLKTAKVLQAEKIKKSKKLMKLKIDLGGEQRQIIAGIAAVYEPEQIIGKNIVVVANLQPAKLMGEESNGMLLAADTAEGGLELVEFSDIVKPGTRIK